MRPFTPAEYLRACTSALAVAPAFLRRPYTPPPRWRAYQRKRIALLLRHAYHNTRFYRGKFDAAGVTPEDFRELADLRCFPTTTKAELIDAAENGELTDVRDGRIASVSSGSSGKIITVQHEVRDTHAYAVGRYRILAMTGALRPWDRILYVYTSELPASSLFGMYRSAFVSTLTPIDEIIAAVRHVRPRVLCIYPSRLCEVADALSPAEARELGLALISVNSEMSSAEQRGALARHFGCPVLDEYSTEELGWTATECQYGVRHLWEDMSYIEILDRDADVPADGVGEIVGTNLHNFSTPFIRYRQEDLGAIARSRCACGRTFRELHQLVGRANDAFQFGSERLSSAYLLDAVYRLLLAHRLPIADFCLVQDGEWSVVFQYLPRGRSDAMELAPAIERHLTALLPKGVNVRAQVTSEMLKTRSGKRNPIISLATPAHRETARV